MKIGLVILSLNAGAGFSDLLSGINRSGDFLCQKLVIDSESDDDTPQIAAQHGFEVLGIKRRDFNHGGTRQLAAEYMKGKADVLIFLTQDVEICDDECLREIVAPFADEKIGAVYGRQLPHKDASPMASLLRAFNYPGMSAKKTFADREKYGIKTPFLSDSFAAYSLNCLFAAGGFPPNVRCSEDMYVGAKLLTAGFAIYYNAKATVRHSHEFTLKSAWKRYRDVGIFQAQESWIGETFGNAEGEGIKLLKSQLNVALKEGGISLAAKIIFDDALKFLAYKYGKFIGRNKS